MKTNPPPALPLGRLPTLQRNALRKLFDRPEFTPEEVSQLGYHRLQQAEGIGQKGLSTIQAWLREYGFELEPDAQAIQKQANRISRRERRNVDSAMRILRDHGYVVLPRSEEITSAD